MLKYLIIPLASTATSFCCYPSSQLDEEWINVDTLKKGILWALKENLSVQFVYPKGSLPTEIKDEIDTIDHVSIMSASSFDKQALQGVDIVVFDSPAEMGQYSFLTDQSYVVRSSFKELTAAAGIIKSALSDVDRLNIVISDIEEIDDALLNDYQEFLNGLIPGIVEEYKRGHNVQLNLLTDRLMLESMNNCYAGSESITLAPDGNFYICPAFYVDGHAPIGNIDSGIEIKNPQLFNLSHAPICRICDAYHCKRCVWMNQKLSREINTPGRQQCLISHIERNASQELLKEFHKIDPGFMANVNIPEIDYLDPFDKLTH
ncbi:MAG: CXXX repeat peptide maturase [Muribaculaceae bacterium]|nr:CXXX repeat peptide maturase [Muribaculaceae bacterium]